VDQESFRHACARWATGVSIATVTGADHQPHGLTVSSFTVVSWHPHLVLVSIDHRSSSYRHFATANAYTIHVLGDDQEDLSTRFSRPGEDRFSGLIWSPGATGAPLIPGALAEFDCAIVDRINAGDHTLFIGEVKRAASREGRPLIYFNRAYRRITG
jgi:flavin reductase (DIM6/NTAB) family NADH-FMN oxidoreductase RutF